MTLSQILKLPIAQFFNLLITPTSWLPTGVNEVMYVEYLTLALGGSVPSVNYSYYHSHYYLSAFQVLMASTDDSLMAIWGYHFWN